jgi:2-C-methyl-D-erythritol 4-phosphate cytidylyltransferase
MNKVYAIIPAGGSGKRIGGNKPKQFMTFNGRELIAYTINIFNKCKKVDEIIVAVQPEYIELIEKIKYNFGFDKLTKIVEGGKERQDSVFNALISLKADKKDFVLVHDAARPLLPQKVLDNAIDTAIKKGNAVVAIKAKDTLVNGREIIFNYINRGEISYIQTPQVFKYTTLLKAMQKARDESFLGTDESMLVTRMGEIVNLVEGSSLNFKVTTESDIELFHQIVGIREIDF